jgi:uncharacterized protein YutE (UPF0331/DUF86 family)
VLNLTRGFWRWRSTSCLSHGGDSSNIEARQYSTVPLLPQQDIEAYPADFRVLARLPRVRVAFAFARRTCSLVLARDWEASATAAAAACRVAVPHLREGAEPMASNREALRKLSRRLPTPPEIEAIMASLRGRADMEVAIVATAICESSLEKLIEAKFKDRDANLRGRIFLNRGPLNDFDSKILVARAFAIITGPMAEELHSLQAIRNTFAHTKIHIDFSHDLIDREIRALRMPAAMLADQIFSGRRTIKSKNKETFLLVIRILLIIIDACIDYSGTADDAIANALTS